MASTSSTASPSTSTSGSGTHPSTFSEPISILQPLTYSASSCGYCSTVPGSRSLAKTSKSYGAWAHALSCEMYKDLLDRGWRRSGCYIYKPDMSRTCCPQYTISLDTSQFKPSRGQRQVLSRFAAFIRDGDRQGQPGWGPPLTSSVDETSVMQVDEATPPTGDGGEKKGKEKKNKDKDKDKGKGSKGKGKARAPDADWTELVHAGDWTNDADSPLEHRFEYTLEPASYTDEKFDLYKKYQTQVHHEAESTVSSKSFKRFLIDTPLELEPTLSSSSSYGSHHACYRLDGRLIAFAVLDILPRAVSSVYFVWDPEYAGMSLGKVSALREAAMVKELEAAGAWEGGGGRYMMGYYIHTCSKMRYKADYQPSFLLDPPTNTYYPWSVCKPRLDATTSGMTTFSGDFSPPPAPPLRSSSSTPADPVAQTSPSADDMEAASDPPTLPKPQQPSPAATSTAPPDEDVAATNSDSNSDLSPPSDSVSDEEEEEDPELDTDFPSPPPPGCLDPNNLPIELLAEMFVIQRRTLMPFLLSDAWRDADMQREARELLATVGEAGRKRLAIFFGR
ncbi:hypothetical protein JCM10908_003240 [Rhodotorula pacifica]|uniref:arginyltransferase n=1 Tax=Rhodotorula pacifica TaxID=1495444 RepID=UPI0031738C15